MSKNSAVNTELRDLLFPEDKPEPDEFIRAIAELCIQIKKMKHNQKQ